MQGLRGNVEFVAPIRAPFILGVVPEHACKVIEGCVGDILIKQTSRFVITVAGEPNTDRHLDLWVKWMNAVVQLVYWNVLVPLLRGVNG